MRAGRTRIPIGPGSWLWTRAYVGDVAGAVLATLGNPRAAGRSSTRGAGRPQQRGWAEQILAAAGHEGPSGDRARRGRCPRTCDPPRTYAQHLVFDGYKAYELLGRRPTDPAAGLARSVRWHLAHPPADASTDFSADDKALDAAP